MVYVRKEPLATVITNMLSMGHQLKIDDTIPIFQESFVIGITSYSVRVMSKHSLSSFQASLEPYTTEDLIIVEMRP